MRATIFPIFFASVLAGVLPLAAQKPLPVASAGNYVITAGALAVTVGPSEGGRIRSLKYQGTEMFYVVTGGNPSSLGTTFWPSPQAHWSAACRAAANIGCWEPPVAFDGTSANYTGGVIPADTSVSFTSAADNATPTGTKGGGTRVRIRKTLWGNTMDSSITVRYHIINTDTVKKAFAPWELTRFVTGGLTFYAKSTEDTLKGNGTAGTAMMNMITDTLGVKWHKYDSANVPTSGTAKFWDGTSAGWYAHVDKSRNLYIKKFQDIPTSKKAPIGENQIELYSASRTGTSGGMAYMEMELQGAFDSIAVGDSLTWDVQWFVRKLPDSIPVTRNSALLALVNQIVGTGPVSVLQDLRMSQASLGYVNRRVSFELTTPGQVSLSLVNASGQVVQKIHSGAVRGGRHEFRMNAAPKGVYWLVLKAAGSSGQIHTQVKRVAFF